MGVERESDRAAMALKAMSVRQPWAWLIITGEKPIENRSWETRYRGPLLIHASLTFDFEGLQWVRHRFPRIKLPDRYPTGAIVGQVEMTEITLESTSPWFAGPYGLVFRHPVQLPRPIPYRGQLGIFEVPGEVLKNAA